jgi:hypothetical protein
MQQFEHQGVELSVELFVEPVDISSELRFRLAQLATDDADERQECAQCTHETGDDGSGHGRGLPGLGRLLGGAGGEAARRAALLAAARARRAGITLSVVYPDDRADVAFAHLLAGAGGGRARGLR